MKIYLIAGEPSGDALGARLISAMKRKYKGEVEFFGVGGETMLSEGFTSLFDITDLAIMGLAEVIPSIPKVLKRINETVEDIKKVEPDVVVTIDSWSFSCRVHKKLRNLGLGIKQVHYVAPQVWAWKKKRAETMHEYIDLLLTLFPDEPQYFTPYDLEAKFVGHPVIESRVVDGRAEEFRKKFEIGSDKRVVLLLPGSRHNEVSRLLPLFFEAAKDLYSKDNKLYFVIPTVSTVSKRVKKMAEKSNLPVLIVDTENDRHNAVAASEAAMAASGTVALELAIANVPHIIAYKVSVFSAFLARMFLKIKFVNLSNILLNKEIVPELIQELATVENINKNMTDLLAKGRLYQKQMDGFAKVQEILGMGKQRPSERASEAIVAVTKQSCEKGVACVYSEE